MSRSANVPTSDLILWTGFSIVIAAVHRHHDICHARCRQEEYCGAGRSLMNQTVFLSCGRLKKYFWVGKLLILVQVLLGVITAHYGVEGGGFYGLDITGIIPYSIHARARAVAS